MTLPKKRYNNQHLSIIMSWNLQFVLGLVPIFLVGIVVWGLNWSSWFNDATKFNSLVVVFSVYVSSYISIRRFLSYLGYLNLRYVMPVMLVWSTLCLGVLFTFRFAYSVYFLTYSLLAITFFFWAICYIRNRYGRFRVAYVTTGLCSNMPKVKTIEWIPISSPCDFNEQNHDLVIADLRANLGGEWESFLAKCSLNHIPVYHSSRFFESISGRVKIDHLYENELGSLLPSEGYSFFKRLFEALLILLSLPVVLPIMLITALLIALESRGHIFFSQERVGQRGEIFTMYKFRSMYSQTDNDKTTGSSDDRVTRVGRVIRKFRIDELPQFFNVIKGDMSLIGPRAEFIKFANDYEKEIPFYAYRHIVKPGISGWAQVLQGYNYGIDETKVKLEYDFYYIKNFSFALDLLIVFKTIHTMLTGFGAR